MSLLRWVTLAVIAAAASGCLIYDESLLEEDDEGGGGAGGSAQGGAGGAGGGGCQGVCQHLLISEFAVTPTTAEFIEIFNPREESVPLGTVYLADFSGYHAIASGSQMVGGADFLVRFPSGTIEANGRIVVAVDPASTVTSDYTLESMSGDKTPGTSGLANAGEMLVLFQWDGVSATVQDLDYVRWGDNPDSVDKSAVSGYQPDTSVDQQSIVITPNSMQSQQRCDVDEPGETKDGGNGVIGHDETSENLGAAFVIGPPSPGTSPGAGVCP